MISETFNFIARTPGFSAPQVCDSHIHVFGPAAGYLFNGLTPVICWICW
jgi:hypothetical protein